MRRTDSPDTTRSYFRSAERIFSLNGHWFFGTREGEVGPFVSRQEALSEVARFVREKHDLELFQSLREEHAWCFTARSLEGLDAPPPQPSRKPLMLVPKEEEPLVMGNLAIVRRR